MEVKSKPLTVRISEKSMKRLKVFCAKHDLKIQKVVQDAIEWHIRSEEEQCRE